MSERTASGAVDKYGAKWEKILFGAGNETRTRDPDLGKVVLYQLSYSRLGVVLLYCAKNL